MGGFRGKEENFSPPEPRPIGRKGGKNRRKERQKIPFATPGKEKRRRGKIRGKEGKYA